jgi:ubiquinone/menaquinone biosynthesis C-methylase UbiE
MEAKPSFLGPQTASAFQDPSVVAAYPRRAPYPESVFHKLAGLLIGSSRAVLDAGTGPGDVARRLAPSVKRVDAVDWSAGMIALGKQLPGGDDPRIQWIQGRIEEVALLPPYSLITAGESLHWMDWDTVLPRFAAALEPGGYLAIVHRVEEEIPWADALNQLISRYSTIHDFRPFDMIYELEARGLFRKEGVWRSKPISFAQPLDEHIEALHSTSGLSRERMSPSAASAFDEALRALVTPYVDVDGRLAYLVGGEVVWGTLLGV